MFNQVFQQSKAEKSPVQITTQNVATIEFKLSDDEGRLIDSSEKSGPIVYMHGAHTLIPALEAELENKTVGDTLKTRIAPENAFGERVKEKVMSVPRSHLPEDLEIEVGMQFQAQGHEGPMPMSVIEIEGDTVTMDGNHPFAGIALNFEVKVLDIRPATPEEIQHGHVHGEGGHSH